MIPLTRSRLWAVASGDRSRQVLTCVAAVAQVVLPTLRGPRFDGPDEPPNVIQPAPATFAVWVPIFASALAYAGHQARPTVRSSAALQAAGWPLAGAFAATGLWAPLVRSRRFWGGQVMLAAVATLAETGRRRVARAEAHHQLSPVGVAATAPVAGMLAAWGQAACGVNLAAMLVANGIVPRGPRATAVGMGLLTALGALGLRSAIGPTRRSVATRAYVGTLIWALAGVAVGQRHRSPVAAATAALAGLAVLAAVLRETALEVGAEATN